MKTNQLTRGRYWVSEVKARGSNAHWAESTRVEVYADARDEYLRIRGL